MKIRFVGSKFIDQSQSVWQLNEYYCGDGATGPANNFLIDDIHFELLTRLPAGVGGIVDPMSRAIGGNIDGVKYLTQIFCSFRRTVNID